MRTRSQPLIVGDGKVLCFPNVVADQDGEREAGGKSERSVGDVQDAGDDYGGGGFVRNYDEQHEGGESQQNLDAGEDCEGDGSGFERWMLGELADEEDRDDQV